MNVMLVKPSFVVLTTPRCGTSEKSVLGRGLRRGSNTHHANAETSLILAETKLERSGLLGNNYLQWDI